jgi:osmotically-inducible protein OsmY
MQSKRSALRFRSPVRFRDRWQGRLVSCHVDEDWLVLNIAVSRGLFRPSEVKLPFSIAGDWSDDAVSLDCTSEEAFGRQIAPSAAPATPLSAASRLSVDVRLAGALVERASRRVSHLLLSAGLLAPGQLMVPVTEVTPEAGRLNLAAQLDALPFYRRDSELLQSVRDAIARRPYLTADERRAVGVEVVDGTVRLAGNVRTPQAEAALYEAAASVADIAGVSGAVINDRRLEIDAGRSLDAAGLFRYGRIYLRAALGEVTLSGFLATAAPVAEVVRVTQAVPGVRSVSERFELAPPAPAPAEPPAPPP